MPTNIIRDIPAPFEVIPGPTLLAPSVYYFSEFTAGRLPLEDINYKEIEPPSDLPGYAIANSQDFYLTSNPQYVISLFLNLPSVFFSEFDNYHQVTATDFYRLDLIAYRYYVSVDYWWVIALANNILDPFALQVGQILRIPAEHTLINEWVQRPVKKVRDPDAFFFGTV